MTNKPKDRYIDTISEFRVMAGTDDTPGGSPEPKKERTFIPLDWQPGAPEITFALDRGYTELQIGPLVQEFVTNRNAKGNMSADWNTTFRIFVRRDVIVRGAPDTRQPANVWPN